jgi:aldose 1-epimerase
MAVTLFGRLRDGTEIREAVIAAGDLTVHVIEYGAVIRDVRLAAIDHPLVLGFDHLDDYIDHSPHFGAVAGRSANRISSGRAVIDGRPVQLTLNERGRTHLHGGYKGFGARPWRFAAVDRSSVTLAITGENGEEGYPGNVEVTVRYTIEPPATIRMDATATTDAPTLVNLAQHSYFNLDGSPDILGHEVTIFADAYTPVDDDLIPTGEIRSVAGTPYDLRSPQPIGRTVDGKRFVYDINYVLGRDRAATPRPAARLRSPKSGIALAVSTTEPGVQFYDGVMMAVGVPGLGGRRYPVNGGCCFEPQLYPDAPNHPGFPSSLLRPGETYRQTSLFAFTKT